MLKEFFSICDKLNFSKKKLLVAVSGGVDSMVLCHLLNKLNLDFSIAHVNYNLRGNDSYLDEKFISEYTNKNQIDLFLKNVDLSDENNSIQNKAREIRFSFFNEILSKYNFDFILTAHHLDDNIETIFLNISRGKKISVFSGMNVVNDNIVKPLLFIEKKDILNYAKQNNVLWREDKSNVQNKYFRNYIRNILIPSFRKINKNYKSNFIDLFFKAQKIKFLKDLYFKNELSKVFTVKIKCSTIPPVSASYINGFVLTSNISFIVFSLVDKSNASMSGLPLTVESVKLLDQIPSNCLISLSTST